VSTTTDTEGNRPDAGTAPVVVRRRRGTTNKKRRRALLVGGLALITVGILLLGWLGWQFWGTNWVSKGRQADVVADLQRDWTDGKVSAETDFGKATGILRVPRFGADYEVPILEGSSDEVLAAGVGHMDDTADVGESGNYVLAAHRVTHGEPFADFPELQTGDLVHIETVAADYTYELDSGGTDLTVPFTADWVLAPFPVNPDPGGTTAPGKPGDQLITLVTCSEIFHTDNRSVAFGHLVDAVDKLP
jgi:sortase A